VRGCLSGRTDASFAAAKKQFVAVERLDLSPADKAEIDMHIPKRRPGAELQG
jgi:hypothetical protein